ncbi:MAG: leucine-rich repeat protein [Paludibacteraceae bacterium]|nr:leucine-rich repeat protein [Paludibacteraceae bacterium]
MKRFFLFVAALCCMAMMSLSARAQVMQVDKGRVIEVINLSQLRAALEDGDVIYEGKKSTLRKTDTVRIMKDITWKSRVLFFSAATCGTLNLDLNGHTLRRTLYDNHEYFQCALTIAADFFPYDLLVEQWAEDHSHDDQYEYKLNEHHGTNVLDVKVNIFDSKGNGKIICDNTIPDDDVRKINNSVAVLINESPGNHFNNSLYGDNLFSIAEYHKYVWHYDGIYHDDNYFASFIEFNLYGGSLIGQMNGEEFYQQNLTSSQVKDYVDNNGKVHANYGLYNDNNFQYKKNDPSTTINVYGGYMTRLFTCNYLNLNMYGGQLGGEKTMNEYLPALIMGEQAEFRPYGVGLFAHFTDGILYGMTILAQQCGYEGNPTWTEWITDLEIGVSFGQGTRPMIDGEILTLDEWMDKICKHDETEYNYKVEFVRDYSRVEIDGLVYKMDPANLTAVVIADKEEDESNYASLPSKVYVPATVNCANKTFKVTGIGDNAFYTCSAIQEIVLPESLVSVGDAAFYSCANLQHVSLPSSIRRIGKGAFWNCSELSEITIPQGVTAIPENTFNGCVKLEKVNMPTSVNTIGNAAFRGCALSKLILPEGVSSLGSGAFSACNNLHWVYNRRVTPQNISGKNVFGGITVSGIKLYVPFGCGDDYKSSDVWGDFDIEEEHPKYGSLFYILDQNRLTAEVTYSSTGSDNYNTLSGKVVVPATITVDENEYQVIKIGTQAFASNTTIEEIELPEGIEEIAASAFSEAEALTKLNIPQSVKAIPNSIIYNSGIYNNDANYTNKCLYIDGCLLDTKSDISGTVQVKEGTRLISGSAFAGRNSITSIRFPIALRYIGQNAFNSCTNLTEISIPEGVKEINRSTFVNCAKLENVKLPMSLEKIDNYAFSDCFNLQRIVIPANVQAIGKSAFDGSGVSQLEEVTLPAGIREIEESAFGNQSELKTIYIYAPDPSLMMLGENVFNLVDKEFCTFYVPYGSKALYMAADEWKDFKIEEMNPCIGGLYYSFNDEELTARVVCDQCNSDANYAALEGDVTIPATVIWNEKEYKVTVVSPNSFSYSPRITSLTFPSTISTIQYNSAEGCPSLVRVTIPSSVKKIEEYAFADCQKLYEINLPDGLEEIEERAFAGCENMTYIRIPSSLKTFGPYVFEGCSDIMEIYNFSETPQDIKDQYVFIDADPSMVTLYIPLGTESEYMNADVWQDFLIEEYKTVLSVTSEDENKGTVDGSGEYTRETIVEISATPEEGYVFDGWDDGEMQNPRKLLLDMDNIDIMASFTVKTFLVSFLDWDGSVLKSAMVNYNESAEAPENEPEREGYTFAGWDGDFSSVTEDLVITALYEMMETPIVIAGQKITPDMYNTMISGEGIEGDVFVTENGIFLNEGATIYSSDPSIPAIELTATDKVNKFIISGVDAQIFNSIVISGKAEVQFNGALPDGIEHDGPLSLKLGADVWWNTEHTIELTEGAQVKLILNGIESESQDSLTFYSKSEAIHTPVGASCDIHAGGNVDFFIYNENCPVGYNDRTFTLHNTAMVLPYGGSVTKEGVLDAAGEEMFALRLSNNAPFQQSGKAYPIELCGVTVSEGTADDILGDGKASYDAETNTLSLDGMEVYRSEYQALRVVKSSINVEVKGENEFIEHSIRPAIEVENGDLRIFGDKDAKLHIDNYKSVVIRGDRTGKYRVAFEGCNVSVFASSGYTALEADSLYIDAANVSIGSQYDIAWRSMNPNKNGGLVLKHAVLKEGLVNVSSEMLFEPVPQYKVTFHDKDGNLIEEQYVFEGEGAVAPDAPEVEGMTFLGWSLPISEITKDITVQAEYEHIVCHVEFHDWDGKVVYQQDLFWGSKADRPIDPYREGYTFTGWDKDFSAVKEDMVITAQYAINTFTVRFYDHNDQVISTQTVNWNEAAIEPELTPWEGHTFTSWSADFEHVQSDLDIKPIYDVQVYKVTFLGFNDTELKVENVEYGKNATAPSAPEVDGYTFTGWDKDFDNITGDLTVKAVYEKNPDLTPQNLNAELTEKDGDTEITLSWDKVAGVPSYEVKLTVGEKELGAKNTFGKNSVTELLSAVVKEYSIKPGTYLVSWAVRSTDIMGTAVSDWAEGIAFQITVKDTGTGIDEANSQQPTAKSQKLLRDGMLYILREGKMYNAQGQKVQ